MGKGKGFCEILAVCSVALGLDLVTERPYEIDAVILSCSLGAFYGGLVKIETILYIMHLILSCKYISGSGSISQERIGWVLSACEGWYLGLNYDYKPRFFSVIGKVLTFVWLNYTYGFDIISPNFIAYIPVIVSRLYFNPPESFDSSSDLFTNSHLQSQAQSFSLPTLFKFQPLEASLPIISLFYQSGSSEYLHNSSKIRVVSIISSSKIHLKVIALDSQPSLLV